MNTGLNAMLGSRAATQQAASNANQRPQTARSEPGSRFSQMLRDCDLPRATEPVKLASGAPGTAENKAENQVENKVQSKAENSIDNAAASPSAPSPRSPDGRTETQRQDARHFAKRASDAAQPPAGAQSTASPHAAKTTTGQAVDGETLPAEMDQPAGESAGMDKAADEAAARKDATPGQAMPLASTPAPLIAGLPPPAAPGLREAKRPGDLTETRDTRETRGTHKAREPRDMPDMLDTRDSRESRESRDLRDKLAGPSNQASMAGRGSANSPSMRAAAEPPPTADLARSFASELKDAAAFTAPAVAVAELKAAASVTHSEPASFEAVLSAAAVQPGTRAVGDVGTPPATTLAQPLYSPAFAPELAARISVWAADGVQQAQLLLNPAEMGPVAVQIVVEGQQAQISFHAEQADTRAVLERSLPDLAAALRDAGLTLSGGGVFQSASGQTGGRSQAGAGADAEAGSRSPRRAAAGGSDAVTDATRRALPPARATRGVVDLYA